MSTTPLAPAAGTAPAKPATSRITSLDQFRGYTVAGMFLVNFLGVYAATPLILKHHNTFCSYADTIMPQFFFAVGFAFRLTFGRRAQTEGIANAYWHVVKRMAGLVLVALVVYNIRPVAGTWQQLTDKGAWEVLRAPLKGAWFQTLTHIAVTTLWILPVIRSSAGVRVAYMIFSAVLQVVVSYWFYFDWVQHGAIDGGPLGFLSWSVPTLVGTLACDAVATHDGRPRLASMILWSVILMGTGYLLSCPTTLYNVTEAEAESVRGQRFPADPVLPTRERLSTHTLELVEPPFVPPPGTNERQENYWMMSQRAGTVSYHVFGAGLSLAVYALFYIVCDIGGWQLGLFRTLGTNALVGYILHGMVGEAVSAFVPKDSPGWYVTAAFLLYFGITYLFIRHLEKNKIYLKL